MGRKLLKTVQTITTFQNPLADPVGTRRGPPLVRGPQFENRCFNTHKHKHEMIAHLYQKINQVVYKTTQLERLET